MTDNGHHELSAWPLTLRMRISHLILAAAICAASLLQLTHAADGPADWPERVVAIHELRTITPLRLQVPPLVSRGEVRGPAALRAHVDASGKVVKVELIDSCGNGDLDEAAIRALRGTQFRPYLLNGEPIAVTLAVPVHIPKNLGRSR